MDSISGRMGRYAFFNTGFEYKFSFARQPSEDILRFGGTGNIGSIKYDPAYGLQPFHQWTSYHKEYIERQLETLSYHLNIELIDFESFDKSQKGTYKLLHSLWATIGEGNDELSSRYILGCLIYHQLLYTEELTCTYEL